MDWNLAWQQFIFSLLGGGIGVAIVEWRLRESSRRKERKIQNIRDQIQNLYGPLYYIIRQDEIFFDLNDKFHKAYKKEYIDKQYSLDESTQENLHKETDEVIKIMNDYVAKVKANNHRIRKIFEENYSYIDYNDIELSLLFFEHYTRMETELSEKGLRTPFLVYGQIGNISHLRPEFIKGIKEKFSSKKCELDKLLNE